MNHMGTVSLGTERLNLRRLKIDDAEEMFNNWANDEEVCKYLTWMPHSSISVTSSILEEWVSEYENKNFYQWGIEIKGEKLIGTISVVGLREDIDMVSLGYCISRDEWGKGYTAEALERIIKFLFEDVGVNRIEAIHVPENPNSGRVMEKCNMKYEGTLINHGRNNQGICDDVVRAILKDDWNKIKNNL